MADPDIIQGVEDFLREEDFATPAAGGAVDPQPAPAMPEPQPEVDIFQEAQQFLDQEPPEDPLFKEAEQFLQENPLTYKEVKEEEWNKLSLWGKIKQANDEIAQGVAFGDNILANTIRLFQQKPQEGETEKEYRRRLQVEGEIRDEVLLSSGFNKGGEVLADVGLAIGALSTLPVTLPVVMAEGAATLAVAGGLRREVRGDETTLPDVARDASLGAVGGGVAFGALTGASKVGAAIWNRVAKKEKLTPEDLLEDAAVEPVVKVDTVKIPAWRSKTGVARVKRVERQAKKVAKEVVKEAEKLEAKGHTPTAALEQAAFNRGIFEELGVGDDLIRKQAQPSLRKAERAAERLAKRERGVRGALAESFDNWVGQVNQRVKLGDYRLGNSLDRMEADTHVQMGVAEDLVGRMEKAFRALPKQDREVVDYVLSSKGPEAADAVLKKLGSRQAQDLRNIIQESTGFIKGLGDELFVGAKNVTRLPVGQYWPRARKTTEAKDSDEAVFEGLQGRESTAIAKTANLKERTLKQIPWEQREEYLPATDALYIMAEAAIRSNTRRAFLGRNLTEGGADRVVPYGADVRGEVNKLLRQEVEAGRLLPQNAKWMGDILKTRFVQGERPAPDVARALADVTRASLLGQWSTTFIQLSDSANILALRGIRDFLGGVFKSLPKEFGAKEVGLGNRAFMELSGRERSGKTGLQALGNFTDRVMRITGMTKIDRAFTTTGLRAGRSQVMRQLKTDKGTAKFISDMRGFATEEELALLIPMLRRGDINPKTASLYFAKQMELKPLSKSQSTQRFLVDESLNRMMGVLKSFTVHQMGITRARVIEEFLNGSKVEATKNAAALVAAWTLLGVPVTSAIGYLKGEDIKIEDEFVDNALVHVGMSQYVKQQADKGAPAVVESLANFAPFSFMARVYSDTEQSLKEEENYKWTRNIPVVGSVMDLMLGGRERTMQREAKEAQQELEKEFAPEEPGFFEQRRLRRLKREEQAFNG